MASRHPTDEERQQAAEATVRRFAEALAAGDLPGLCASYREDCALVVEAGVLRGREAAEAWHAGAEERWPGLISREVTRSQQHGAHAAIGWTGRADAGADLVTGLSVIEVRNEAIVWEIVSETPA